MKERPLLEEVVEDLGGCSELELFEDFERRDSTGRRRKSHPWIIVDHVYRKGFDVGEIRQDGGHSIGSSFESYMRQTSEEVLEGGDREAILFHRRRVLEAPSVECFRILPRGKVSNPVGSEKLCSTHRIGPRPKPERVCRVFLALRRPGFG